MDLVVGLFASVMYLNTMFLTITACVIRAFTRKSLGGRHLPIDAFSC